MKTHPLGKRGPAVSPIGLGCMAFSGTYGPAEESESIATIHDALDAGISLIDTGDFYGVGHNEMLLREALKDGRRDRVFIQVKFGAQVDPSGAFIGFDARPNVIRTALAYTLRRLGTDHVDLYQPSRLDPAVPIEETVGTIADLVKSGYVRFIGLSEVGATTIRRAHAVHPITSLQIEYSLMSRGIEREILPTARELGIGVTAYGLLSRGLLTGSGSEGLRDRDIRRRFPRFQGENLRRNLPLVKSLEKIADEKKRTPAQLAVAWVLSRGEDIVPLIGPRNRNQLKDLLGALDPPLTPEEITRIESAVPSDHVSGNRYYDAGMLSLDSEKSAGKS